MGWVGGRSTSAMSCRAEQVGGKKRQQGRRAAARYIPCREACGRCCCLAGHSELTSWLASTSAAARSQLLTDEWRPCCHPAIPVLCCCRPQHAGPCSQQRRQAEQGSRLPCHHASCTAPATASQPGTQQQACHVECGLLPCAAVLPPRVPHLRRLVGQQRVLRRLLALGASLELSQVAVVVTLQARPGQAGPRAGEGQS